MPAMKDMLKRLSDRERMLLYGAVLLLIVFLIYQFGVSPFLRARDKYRIENAELSIQLRELKEIAEKYLAEKYYYDQLSGALVNKKSLSVLTYLENVAGEVGVREKIEYIRPKGSESRDGISSLNVEMKVDAIEVQNLVMFLYRIEELRNGLIVSSLRLKPFYRERGKVDAVVTITDITAE